MYIGVNYFGDNSKTYIYKCKYRTIKRGDFVVGTTTNGNTVAKVDDINMMTPQFQCKEVIRKVDINEN